jgi:hypothetical protein
MELTLQDIYFLSGLLIRGVKGDTHPQLCNVHEEDNMGYLGRNPR